MKNIERAPVADSSFVNVLRSVLSKTALLQNAEETDKVLLDFLRHVNENYLYWDKAKYKLSTEFRQGEQAARIWSLIKQSRRQHQRKLVFGSHSFTFTTTDAISELLHKFDLHLGGALGGQHVVSDAEKHQFLVGSIMEESIASSQIEGAITSRVVAKEMLRKSRPPRTLSERMIINNYLTIQHIIQTKNNPLTPETLLDMHRLMTTDTLDNPEEAGQLRQHDDIHVVDAVNGEVIHTPPSFTTLPAFLDDLCRFFNDETPAFFLHPIVKASIVHFLIGYFHPFTDGNGRTARALLYWYLLKKGYWLTEYLSISRVIMQSRAQYYRAFQYTEIDENDLTYFVFYQVRAMSKAYDELKNYMERKRQEKQNLFFLQRDSGLSPRQAEIVGWLLTNPNSTLSAREVATRLGVANQTARADIQELIQRNYLTELIINKKERHYVRGSHFEK